MMTSQGGLCFYCAKSLGIGWAIDHFVPWSKYPNNAVENLVAACKKCNGDKSDKLVAPAYVKAWITRCNDVALIEEMTQMWEWDTNVSKSFAIARSFYTSMVPGSVIWSGFGSVELVSASHLIEFEALFA